MALVIANSRQRPERRKVTSELDLPILFDDVAPTAAICHIAREVPRCEAVGAWLEIGCEARHSPWALASDMR